jgi:D-tyrosyl-tRNA(Tyr) deacylase
MRAVIQRVREASVAVDGEVVGSIGRGLLVLLGVFKDDRLQDVESLEEKIAQFRIFEDDQGKMNRSLLDVGGEALVVSQFTLAAETKKGRRPGFDAAAPPEQARELYEVFVELLKGRGVRVATGVFGAKMQVALVNDGPVTFVLDSR